MFTTRYIVGLINKKRLKQYRWKKTADLETDLMNLSKKHYLIAAYRDRVPRKMNYDSAIKLIIHCK